MAFGRKKDSHLTHRIKYIFAFVIVIVMLVIPMFTPGDWTGGILNKPSAIPPSLIAVVYYFVCVTVLALLCRQVWIRSRLNSAPDRRSIEMRVDAHEGAAFDAMNMKCDRGGVIEVRLRPRWHVPDFQVSLAVSLYNVDTDKEYKIGMLVFDAGTFDDTVVRRIEHGGSCSLRLSINEYRCRKSEDGLDELVGDASVIIASPAIKRR